VSGIALGQQVDVGCTATCSQHQRWPEGPLGVSLEQQNHAVGMVEPRAPWRRKHLAAFAAELIASQGSQLGLPQAGLLIG